MKKIIPWLAVGAVLAIMWAALAQSKQRDGVRAGIVAPAAPPGEFQRADGQRAFSFPLDHGPHDSFQTEWWYFTGNLAAVDGRRFGYQLTFFRRALLPEADRTPRGSNWAVEQVYLAHFTLTDVANDYFQYWERMTRGSAGLAGARVEPLFEVWLYDWQVEQLADNRFRLQAAQDEVALALTLEDVKGPVLQHEEGFSPKGPQPGNASYYYSLTRLESSGTLQLDGQSFNVRGISWMDHEFSTSALSAGQVGWDWFSLQLDSGREIMVYTIRREDGTVDPYSTGTIVEPDGSSSGLSAKDFIIEGTGTWKSPSTEVVYPSGWVLSVPGEDIRLVIQPRVKDQELVVSYVYWEGAVFVEGSWGGQPVTGQGYVELTGYGGSMAGQF